MQFSTNSDAAILQTIRAGCTLAGQYRLAVLQKRDRQAALTEWHYTKSKSDAEIRLKQTEYKQLEVGFLAEDEPLERAKLEAQLDMLRLEIEQIQVSLQQCSELVEDALREIAVCDREIARINASHGSDMSTLPASEFQKLMTSEHALKTARWIAARTLSAQTGVPIDAAELLLELPEADRGEIFKLQHLLTTRAIAQMSSAINPSSQAILNGTN